MVPQAGLGSVLDVVFAATVVLLGLMALASPSSMRVMIERAHGSSLEPAKWDLRLTGLAGTVIGLAFLWNTWRQIVRL